jgi:hypothetical protein
VIFVDIVSSTSLGTTRNGQWATSSPDIILKCLTGRIGRVEDVHLLSRWRFERRNKKYPTTGSADEASDEKYFFERLYAWLPLSERSKMS